MTLENIGDGRIPHEINDELGRIIADVLDRAFVKGPRTVTLEIRVEPEIDEDTGTNYPVSQYKISTKMPGRMGPRQVLTQRGDQLYVHFSYASALEKPEQTDIEKHVESKQKAGA